MYFFFTNGICVEEPDVFVDNAREFISNRLIVLCEHKKKQNPLNAYNANELTV